MRRERRQGIGIAITNWRESALPVPRRFAVAVLNWSRRFHLPPRDCCGHPGEPGC